MQLMLTRNKALTHHNSFSCPAPPRFGPIFPEKAQVSRCMHVLQGGADGDVPAASIAAQPHAAAAVKSSKSSAEDADTGYKHVSYFSSASFNICLMRPR